MARLERRRTIIAASSGQEAVCSFATANLSRGAPGTTTARHATTAKVAKTARPAGVKARIRGLVGGIGQA
jgi:hypothetical protein